MTVEKRLHLRTKMHKEEKKLLVQCAAMVATFSVTNNITLQEAEELFFRIIEAYGQALLDSGDYHSIKAEYEQEKAKLINDFLKQLKGGGLKQ